MQTQLSRSDLLVCHLLLTRTRTVWHIMCLPYSASAAPHLACSASGSMFWQLVPPNSPLTWSCKVTFLEGKRKPVEADKDILEVEMVFEDQLLDIENTFTNNQNLAPITQSESMQAPGFLDLIVELCLADSGTRFPPQKSATRYFHHFASAAAVQPFRIPRLREQLIRLRLSFTPERDLETTQESFLARSGAWCSSMCFTSAAVNIWF